MIMGESLLQWCVDELLSVFGLEASEDIVRYILSIEKAEEIEEYVGDLLQGTDGRKQEFIDELLYRWKLVHRQETDSSVFVLTGSTSPSDGQDVSRDGQKKSKRKGRNKQEVLTTGPTEAEPEEVKTPIDLMKAQENAATSSTKKKNKFTNLYAKEGQDKLTVLLPGRHGCDCLAQKHKLINNCISCGRIVCDQEGSGPCLFCGTLVCTREEQEILQRDSNKSQKLRKKLMGDAGEREFFPHHEAKMKAGLEKAVQHKEKLLEYDRNSVRRTQVLDDEADYFATDSNQWLSPQERDKLKKKEAELRELRHASRKDRKITLDFAGRRVVSEDDTMGDYYNKLDETLKAMNQGFQGKSGGFAERKSGNQKLGDLVNPNIVQSAPQLGKCTGEVAPVLELRGGAERAEFQQVGHVVTEERVCHTGRFPCTGDMLLEANGTPWVDVGGSESHQRHREQEDRGRGGGGGGGRGGGGGGGGGEERNRLRLQDKEIQEMSDGGWCLSMHQPWASLLVRGIKRVEGRTWYSSHRGRLWIAAAAKKPTPQEISGVEAMYRHLYNKEPVFPKDYPTGCLLGCVNMSDCLSQEQFREQFPDSCEESSSAFVFICTNAREMLVKFPLKGKHKIWKLESHYHQGAKRGLIPSSSSSSSSSSAE